MSKHFHDARYYLGRAVEHAIAGVKEDLAPVTDRARDLAGVEDEAASDPTRIESVRSRLIAAGDRTVTTVRRAVASRRETIDDSRRDGDAA